MPFLSFVDQIKPFKLYKYPDIKNTLNEIKEATTDSSITDEKLRTYLEKGTEALHETPDSLQAFLRNIIIEQTVSDSFSTDNKTTQELEILLEHYRRTIQFYEDFVAIIILCKQLMDEVIKPLDLRHYLNGKGKHFDYGLTHLFEFYARYDEWPFASEFSKILYHTGTILERLSGPSNLLAAGEYYYKAKELGHPLESIEASKVYCLALCLHKRGDISAAKTYYINALKLGYNQCLQYHHYNQSSSRFHLFAVKKEGKRQGDYYKSKILFDFYLKLLECDTRSKFNDCKESFLQSPEYTILATAQGLVTSFAKFLGFKSIKTSSEEAFEAICRNLEHLFISEQNPEAIKANDNEYLSFENLSEDEDNIINGQDLGEIEIDDNDDLERRLQAHINSL